jgi:hypothetical protein
MCLGMSGINVAQSNLNIGGKARPVREQIQPLLGAGFEQYEAVIIKQEDWQGLRDFAEEGIVPTSIDIKGGESDKRWGELRQRLDFLDKLANDHGQEHIYIAVDGFPENIERFKQEPFYSWDSKAIEALPATSPAAIAFKTALPNDLTRKAKETNSLVLADICHLAQTAAHYMYRKIVVTDNGDGTFRSTIPTLAGEIYQAMFNQIARSGLLAPFAHDNGHVFVAHPDQNKPILLADGKPVQAVSNNPQTRSNWATEAGFARNSYSLPIEFDGKPKHAHWFDTHIHFDEDEIKSFLDPSEKLTQAVSAGIETIILEVPKDSVAALKRDAQFLQNALSGQQ